MQQHLMMDEMDRLTNEYTARARALGYGVALVAVDPDEGISIGLSTANVSEATVCAGVLLATILSEGEPTCPHCLNNYRRVEAALSVMREHRTTRTQDHTCLN